MQDFYTHYNHCVPPKPVDGNFDVIPRGIITYTGSIIDSARITSRYVQGTYLKDIDGQLQTMRSFLYQIPLDVNFSAEMKLDNQITALKVEQAIRETFYKTVTFYVYFKGMRIGCSVGFPEDIALEKNIQYSFESNNQIKITFALQVETYQPVFDPTTEVNNNANMTGIGYRLMTKPTPKNDGIITITPETDLTDMTISKGWPYLLEWDYKNENAIINKVDILWADAGSSIKNVIEKGVTNNEFYLWNIPQNFTDFKTPTIIWPNDSSINISVYREPIIAILPELTTNKITSQSFNIVDGGYFLAPTADASFNITLEMKDSNNRVVYSGDTSIYVNLIGNKIDNIIVPNDDVVFPGDVYSKTIDIYIINSINSYDTEIVSEEGTPAYGIIRNVTIV
jgi:hypothetical protein